MIKELMYIELKTGYSDDGPAWIGYVQTSKTRKTIYFNDHAFQKNIGNYANYMDIENGEEYWISGLKKKESNRHWAGHGKIMIDRRAVDDSNYKKICLCRLHHTIAHQKGVKAFTECYKVYGIIFKENEK